MQLFFLLLATLCIIGTIQCFNPAQLEESLPRHDALEQISDIKLQMEALRTSYHDQKVEISQLKQTIQELTLIDNRKRLSGLGKAVAWPGSCNDLDRLGHILSGFYLVKGSNENLNKLETVFCDFSLSVNDPAFQTSVGFADIKTKSVHFSVQRSTPFTLPGRIVTYEKALWNVGGAIDIQTGIFTAPKNGLYTFAFNGVRNPTNRDELDVILQFRSISSSLFVNLATAHGCNETLQSPHVTASIQVTISMRAGDLVAMYLESGYLYDAFDKYYTTFSGFLVEEDII